jgi:hypothetical protein
MPEDRYALVFPDARFLPCWPGTPPPGAVARVLIASLVNAQKCYFHTIRDPAFRLPAIMLSRAFHLTSGGNGTMSNYLLNVDVDVLAA